MRKIPFLWILLLTLSHASAQQLLTFEFAGLEGSEETAISNFKDSHLETSKISRGKGLTPRNFIDSFSASNWGVNNIPTSVADSNYMEFVIRPKTGYKFTVSSVYIQMRRSDFGPVAMVLRSSLDGFSSDLDQQFPIVDDNNKQSFTFSFNHQSHQKVAYRIYMYAEAEEGTASIGGFANDDIIVYGLTEHIDSKDQIIIARNCDPLLNYGPDRYAEIYNAGDLPLDITNWKLENVQNNVVAFSWTFSGIIAAGETWVCARNDATDQSIIPDVSTNWSGAGWNGIGGDGTILKDAQGLVMDRAVQESGQTFDNKQMKRKLDIVLSSPTYDENEWVFSGVDSANYFIPGFHGTVWEGNINWFTQGNWDCQVPTSTSNAIISSAALSYPNISGTTIAVTKNLELQNGSSIQIIDDGELTVYGDLDNGNGGTLVLRSSASDDGSLIVFGDITGAVSIERFITPYTGNDNGWHLLSSPRTGDFDLSTSAFVPISGFDDVYAWDEPTYTWQNYYGIDNPGFTFIPGYGYLVAYQSQSIVRKYVGEINNHDISFSNLTLTNNHTDASYDGWHLLGNPYASAIKWNDGNWTLNNIVATAQIYNELGGNYMDVSIGGYIPRNQGFFVQAIGGEGSLTIPLESRVHNNTDWYKRSNRMDTLNTLELKVSGGSNSFYDIAKVKFDSEATDDFDIDFDSHKLRGMTSAPQLFTQQGQEEFSTNILAFHSDEKLIALSFMAGTNGSYTIETVRNTIVSEGKTYLEDLQSNQIVDLANHTTYTFYASTDDPIERFVLHFNGVTSITENLLETNFNIHSLGDRIYIENLNMKKAQIAIYNTAGQRIKEVIIAGKSSESIPIQAPYGIYLVRIQCDHLFMSKIVWVD